MKTRQLHKLFVHILSKQYTINSININILDFVSDVFVVDDRCFTFIHLTSFKTDSI